VRKVYGCDRGRLCLGPLPLHLVVIGGDGGVIGEPFEECVKLLDGLWVMDGISTEEKCGLEVLESGTMFVPEEF
jgi:hypothetical protein